MNEREGHNSNAKISFPPLAQLQTPFLAFSHESVRLVSVASISKLTYRLFCSSPSHLYSLTPGWASSHLHQRKTRRQRSSYLSENGSRSRPGMTDRHAKNNENEGEINKNEQRPKKLSSSPTFTLLRALFFLVLPASLHHCSQSTKHHCCFFVQLGLTKPFFFLL